MVRYVWLEIHREPTRSWSGAIPPTQYQGIQSVPRIVKWRPRRVLHNARPLQRRETLKTTDTAQRGGEGVGSYVMLNVSATFELMHRRTSLAFQAVFGLFKVRLQAQTPTDLESASRRDSERFPGGMLRQATAASTPIPKCAFFSVPCFSVAYSRAKRLYCVSRSTSPTPRRSRRRTRRPAHAVQRRRRGQHRIALDRLQNGERRAR